MEREEIKVQIITKENGDVKDIDFDENLKVALPYLLAYKECKEKGDFSNFMKANDYDSDEENISDYSDDNDLSDPDDNFSDEDI